MQRFPITSSQSATAGFAVSVVLIALCGCAPEVTSPTMSPSQTKKNPDKTPTTSNSKDSTPSPPAVQRQTTNDDKPVKLPTTHTVMPGETMYSLSVKYYGTGREVGRIIEANSERNIDVNSMQIGQELTIPALDEQ